MKSLMSRFYDTDARAYRPLDNDSYEGKASKEFICGFLCDIQPVSGELESRAAGLRAVSKVKMYYNLRELRVGDYIETGGKEFIITRIENRRLGSVAYLKGCGRYDY